VIYEYRVYEATPGKMKILVELMGKAVPFFQKHGMKVLGCWTPAVGENDNKYIYILAFNDMAHLEKAWAAFRTDPDWRKAAGEYAKYGPTTGKIYNVIMDEVPV